MKNEDQQIQKHKEALEKGKKIGTEKSPEELQLSPTAQKVLRVIMTILILGILGLNLWVFRIPLFRIDSLGFLVYLNAWFIGLVVLFALWGPKIKAWIYFALPGGLIFLTVFYVIVTSGITGATARYELIGDVEVKEFSEDMKVVDTERLRILDREDALRHGENRLGSESGLGSQFELDAQNFTLQVIEGELFWSAPLAHRGFVRWWNNREGTPGYIKVNATTRDTELVLDQPIRFTESAHLHDNIRRYVYFNHSMTARYTDFSFQLDDQGAPHYAITVFEGDRGVHGNNVEGLLVVHAGTGDMVFYEEGEEYPSWIDRVYPKSFFEERVSWWGRYPNGWFNPSNEGQLRPSTGLNVVYNDGKAYFYTGITSWGGDESTTGFMLMNSKTGEATYYQVSGATERKAMGIAEGRVQNAGYTATFPVLINIGGHPTYFMTLKDQNNHIAEYAFVNVEDYLRSGVSRNIETAQGEYMVEMGLRTDTGFIIDESELQEVEGIIRRINSITLEGDTYFYFMLEDDPEIYRVAFKNHPTTVLTHEGDRVKIQYLSSEDNEVRIFSNNSIR